MKASEYVDIGQYLRDSRESLRISLPQAARDLHIRAKYLTAIESGRLEGLPGKAYIRGYIRNYAYYLHLDFEQVLSAYELQLAHKGQEFFVPEPTLRQNLPSPRAIQWSALGLALLYGYWYFAVHDHAQVDARIPDVPENFLQLLDKTPHAAMDRAWQPCLDAGDAMCFITLHQQAILPESELYHDTDLNDNPPQKP